MYPTAVLLPSSTRNARMSVAAVAMENSIPRAPESIKAFLPTCICNRYGYYSYTCLCYNITFLHHSPRPSFLVLQWPNLVNQEYWKDGCKEVDGTNNGSWNGPLLHSNIAEYWCGIIPVDFRNSQVNDLDPDCPASYVLLLTWSHSFLSTAGAAAEPFQWQSWEVKVQPVVYLSSSDATYC